MLDVDNSNVSPSILRQLASIRELNFARLLIGILIVASGFAAPLHAKAFAAAPYFIPAFTGTTGTADALTAALLFSLYRIDGSRRLLATALAYLINALLTGPYTITFPGVIDAHGFIGNQQSAAWLWLLWHTTFALIVAAGTMYGQVADDPARRARMMTRSIAAGLIFAAIAVLAVTIAHDVLPPLIDNGKFLPLFTALSIFAFCTNATAAALLIQREKRLSTFSAWLMVALMAAALDTALNAISPVRFSSTWYVGKIETFVSASVVLVALLAAWTTLYSQSTALAQRLAAALAERHRLQERLTREHEIAVALQHAALPSVLPTVKGLTLRAIYRPAASDLQIGGDWYDSFVLVDGRLVIIIGDVAGHGLAASIIMSKLRQSLRLAAYINPDPNCMLGIADMALRSEYPDTIATAFVALLDSKAGTLSWACAGHPPAMLRRPDGSIEELDRPAPPLGIFDVIALPINVTWLDPGSMLVAYTDGLIESDKDIIAGLASLRGMLAGAAILAAADPAAALFEAIVGSNARDDVSVVTVVADLARVPLDAGVRRHGARHGEAPRRP